MTTRRALIQVGAAAGAAMAAGPALAAKRTLAPTVNLHRVAFDSRGADAALFAAEARRLGASLHDTRGDATGLYADVMLDAWRKSPVALAGLTSPQELFVLRLMAEGAGLRLVHVGHHAENDHRYYGPAAITEAARNDAGDWRLAAARRLGSWPNAQAVIAPALSDIAAWDSAPVAADARVSWLLAPVSRA